jgi:hypothetical protein
MNRPYQGLAIRQKPDLNPRAFMGTKDSSPQAPEAAMARGRLHNNPIKALQPEAGSDIFQILWLGNWRALCNIVEEDLNLITAAPNTERLILSRPSLS